MHPELFRELDYANYRTETRRNDSIQHSPIRQTAKRLVKEKEDDEALYFWIFPNLMLNVYPDNFSTNLILPLGHGRTLTLFDWFFENPVDPRIEPVVSFGVVGGERWVPGTRSGHGVPGSQGPRVPGSRGHGVTGQIHLSASSEW